MAALFSALKKSAHMSASHFAVLCNSGTVLKSAARRTAAIALAALAGCANLTPQLPEDAVRTRAGDRWQALADGEFEKAYAYSLPSFKAVINQKNYRQRFGNSAAWYGAEVISVTCPEAAKCMAKVRIDFKLISGKKNGDKISTHVDETWILEAGKWWFFQPI